jgi:heptaprenyl diphosphate synthase
MTMRKYDKKLKRTALLVSAAVILQIAESFFPQLVPGVKLGLANMIVLIAIVNIGPGVAFEIAIMRTLISSLILGTFLSPSFVLSFSSAMTSTAAMAGLYMLSKRGKRVYLSLVGISIIGALVHNLTQISLVYLILIKNTGVFMLVPWLGLSAIIMGWVTGTVASQVCARLDKKKEMIKYPAFSIAGRNNTQGAGLAIGRYIKKDSMVHSMRPGLKILAVIALAAAIIAANNFYAYIIFMALLLSAAAMSRIPVMRFFDGVKRLYFFIALSFALPIIFTYGGGHPVFSWGILTVTREGINNGCLSAFRIILLMTGAAVLIHTTSPQELASGIRAILKPFGFIGISGDRVSRIVTSSLLAVPVLWQSAQAFIKNYRMGRKKVKGLVPAVSGLIMMLYVMSENENMKII